MTHRTGVIDLGSNTSRLVIYEHEPGMRFRLVDEVREVVRLREGMGATQVLRAAAIDRSLHALKMYRVLCDAVGVDDLIAVGTERGARRHKPRLVPLRASRTTPGSHSGCLRAKKKAITARSARSTGSA